MSKISPEAIIKRMENVLRMRGYKYEKYEAKEQRGFSNAIIAQLPTVYGVDGGGIGYEVNSDLIFGTIDPGAGRSSFTVWYGMPFKMNRTMHQYSPHAIQSPVLSPWGQLYYGYFCGANNLVKYRTLTDLVKITHIQLARCEGHYHVPSQHLYKCVHCGSEFENSKYGIGSAGWTPVCAPCAYQKGFTICTDKLVRERGSRLACATRQLKSFHGFADQVCSRLEVRVSV